LSRGQANFFSTSSSPGAQETTFARAVHESPALAGSQRGKQILQAALIYSPDRLSRKYAYQVLLMEELSRCGVEVVFLKAPSGATPEDQLLVQFQGMIAEYERARLPSARGVANATARSRDASMCSRARLTATAT
jgi:hypothetical protein